MIFYMLVQLINVYFIGQTNDATLIAGFGMGNMLINVLAFAVMQGLNGALESLVSVSYGASQSGDDPEYRREMRRTCGLLHTRGRFVVTLVMIPLIVIYCLADKILVGIGQDKEVARVAMIYVVIMLPGVWSMGQFDATKKFLSSQQKTMIPVVVQLISTPLHILWGWLFIRHMDMREVGGAIATNLTYIMNMIMADIWIRATADSTFPDMVFWYRSEDLCNWSEICTYLKIGVPGMFMLCFEWWAFELLAIFSGLLSVTDLAAEVVIINLISFIFMVPLGISYSASGLTGSSLGEGDIPLARRYALITVTINIVITSIIVLLLGIFQH